MSQQTTVNVAPNNTQPGNNPIAGFLVSWLGPLGVLVSAVMQAFAIADPTTGLGASVTAAGTAGANGVMVQGSPEGIPIPVSGASWKYAVINAQGNTPIAATVFGGIFNPNIATQSFEVTVNDNATTNSGPQLYASQAVGPSQPNPAPSSGVALTSGGFVVNCAQAPAGIGLVALYR